MSDREILLDLIEADRKPRIFETFRPAETKFPQLIVTVPDSWPYIRLAPLYDVHIGSGDHDSEKFARHLQWMLKEKYLLTFNGGDFIENATKLSPGGSIYAQLENPNNQLVRALKIAAKIWHKTLFSLPGNHEARTQSVAGVDAAMWFSQMLRIPYFSDYCMCTIKWRGNSFKILAHHGSGAAQTAGAQRMSARKDIAWAKPFDIIWTGHLHSPLVDVLYQTDYDQKTGLVYERSGLVLISPSYVNYFGGYAAQKRYTPGPTGLIAVDLQEDGRLDVQVHANTTVGKRL